MSAAAGEQVAAVRRRVSTDAQDSQLQHDALNDAGCGRIFEEQDPYPQD